MQSLATQVERMLSDRRPFGEIEDRIEEMSASDDEKTALWLLAWSGQAEGVQRQTVVEVLTYAANPEPMRGPTRPGLGRALGAATARRTAGITPAKASQLETSLAEQISRLQADYYGIAPKEARAYYIPGELVMVVLRETFTPAEKVLIGHGDAETIQDSRRRFQQLSGDQFISVIEQLTGEKVEAFLSETHLEQEVAVEVFLLAGEDRTHMEAFERYLQTETGKTRDPEEPDINAGEALGKDNGRRPDGQAGRDARLDHPSDGGG